MDSAVVIDDACAIFGDIVRSRSITDREWVQQRMAAIVDVVNSRYAADILVPFAIYSGDEVRGLLSRRAPSYDIICLIQSAIYPCLMRFAVGIGCLSTALSDDMNAMDGPAFHRVSEAMSALKNRRTSHGRLVLYASSDAHEDAVLNTLVFLVTSVKSHWTEAQVAKISRLGEAPSLLQASKILGISHQAVTKLVAKTDYYAVREAEQLIRSILGNMQPIGGCMAQMQRL